MEFRMKRTSPLIALAAIVGVSALGACNTMEGVGQDVQSAGEAIEDTAEEGTDNDGDEGTP
jgi:predicted small secreted protein